MKTEEDLKAFFEKEIKPKLVDLEKWRKKTRKKFIFKYTVLFIPFVVILSVFFHVQLNTYSKNFNEIFIGTILLLVFLGIPSVIILKKIRLSIKKIIAKDAKDIRFKNTVIGKVVKFISKDLEFSPEKNTITGKEFLESEIFNHSIFYPKGYYAEDFVTGKIGNTNIRFYEINGKDMIFPKSSKKNVKIYDGTVEKIPFLGMFFIVDFYKSFDGHTLVLPEKRINKLQWITASGREPIKLDDPEFEKLFSVHGTDQITSRYVLSNSLMQRIIKYRKKIGRKIYISFSNDKLFIAISHKKNKFEIKLNKSFYDFNRIKGFYHDLKIAYDIVDDLNLNSQIWLKKGEKNSILIKNPIIYKYRKKKLYRILFLTLGIFGVHYFYAGYIGKGLFTLLISLLGFSFLINLTIKKLFVEGQAPSDNELAIPILSALSVFSIFWLAFSYVRSTWINHDSKGYPLK